MIRPFSSGAAVLTTVLLALPLSAQRAPAPFASPAPDAYGPNPNPVQTRVFDGGLAEGPYGRLVIRNVMILPGHGGPPTGPHEILIEGSVISQIRRSDPSEAGWEGDRVIEGEGMYVMPGMLDLHYHVRTDPIPLEYSYYLKLAHGVTTTVTVPDGRFDQIWEDELARRRWEKLAPRQHPFWSWGRGAEATPEQLQDPAEAPRIAREMIAAGGRAVGINGLTWNPESRRRLLNDVADSLVAYGAMMLPTMVVYEASKDILRAQGLPWHEKYTHQALLEWSIPDPEWHGAFHWDWTSDDAESWRYAFDLWGQLIYEFNRRGGVVAMGTDDNYIWATAGFSNIRELQLVRQSGMHNLEVLKAATYNSARALREPNLGLVRAGRLADLILVDGNPAENFRHMYSFGAIRMNEAREMYRSRGIVHTIVDGVVTENARLMEEVARMVAESREGVEPLITQEPFVADPRP